MPSTPVDVPFGRVVYNMPSALPDAWHSTVWRPHELGPDAFLDAVVSQQPLSRDILPDSVVSPRPLARDGWPGTWRWQPVAAPVVALLWPGAS